MSFANNSTPQLWQTFMPRRKEVKSINPDFFSLEVFDDTSFFTQFDPTKEFEKWALVEVENFDHVPPGMDTLKISGLHAVFIFKGSKKEAEGAYRYIYSDWLPRSGYQLDHRPHFAVMGEKYKNDSPDSEEELWVPIKST